MQCSAVQYSAVQCVMGAVQSLLRGRCHLLSGWGGGFRHHCTVSVPRPEEGSTGKYQHEVEGTPKTECWYFPVLPNLSQDTDIIQFIKVMKL